MLRAKFNKNKPFWLGDWYVDPISARLLREDSEAELEPEAMKILSRLVEDAGNVVSFDELEVSAWNGIEVGVNVVADTIIAIRTALDDDPKEPKYIETVPHKGFRLTAKLYYKAPSSRVDADEKVATGFAGDQLFGGGESLFGTLLGLFARKKTTPGKLYTNFFSRGNAKYGAVQSPRYAYYLLAMIVAIPLLLFIVTRDGGERPLPTSIAAAKKAKPETAPAAKAAPLPLLKQRPSIEVVPFTSTDNDKAQVYFSDGISGDLTRALSLYSGLHVVSNESLVNSSTENKQAANSGAHYLVQGKFRIHGNFLDMKVELVDSKTGQNVWEEEFSRKPDDIFVIQDEIRDKIVNALAVSLTDEESNRSRRHDTNKFEAYDHYLRGQFVMKSSTSAKDNDQARNLMKRAIALDPRFVRAYAALGVVYADAWRFGWTKNPEQYAKLAVESGEEAVALDNNSPQAYWSLGYIYLYVHGDHVRAIEMGERAIELDPNSPEGYTLLSVANVFSGKPEMARLLLEGVKNSNPHYRHQVALTQALSNLLLGNHQESLEGLQESLSIDPVQIQANVYKAIVLYRMGDADEAKLQVSRLLDLNPEFDPQAWAQRQPFLDKRITFSLVDDLDRIANL